MIPAHNEEKVIRATIESCIPLVGKENIYVVDDGSSDKTGLIAKGLIKNVLTIQKNRGKATALNTAIVKFGLIENYDFIMPVDSDSIISENFFKDSLPLFEKDKRLVCVVGRVVGRDINWITRYRIFEYEINQTIHKAAQSRINGITVCPGPSTIYRSRVFKKYKYSTDTCTEDMDFTFTIHRKKLGRIIYEPKISVSTQDPKTISSYVKQLRRWYTGFWQCLTKHNVPFGGQPLDFEAALLANDGILNLIFVVMYLITVPVFIWSKPVALLIPPLIDFFVFMLPMVVYVAVKQKKYKVILFLPHFYFMRLLGSSIFLYSFFRVLLGTDVSRKNTWQTERYWIRRREVWAN